MLQRERGVQRNFSVAKAQPEADPPPAEMGLYSKGICQQRPLAAAP
jgi:hypothetical protein